MVMLSTSTIPQAVEKRYGHLGLLDLIERIVAYADKAALDEFHNNRRPFLIGENKRLRFDEFVEVLHRSEMKRSGKSGGYGEEVLDCACNLVTDRFLCLPAVAAFREGRERTDETSTEPETSTTDCRYYFKAFLLKMQEIMKSRSHMSLVETELLACRLLQSHVTRHFALCLKEAARSVNPLTSRYEWKVNGGRVHVRFPVHFPGTKRRQWLEAHVEEPNPGRPGEKERVQEIIDSHLPGGSFTALDESVLSGAQETRPIRLFSWAVMYGVTIWGLASVVAREKADKVNRQRPAIRALGRHRLENLILEIFHRLDSDEYDCAEVAQRFGLSKAALSRFAAKRWRNKGQSGKQVRVPDLWFNVARTLAHHEGFVEAAKDCGVWPRVQDVLAHDSQSRRNRDVQ